MSFEAWRKLYFSCESFSRDDSSFKKYLKSLWVHGKSISNYSNMIAIKDLENPRYDDPYSIKLESATLRSLRIMGTAFTVMGLK